MTDTLPIVPRPDSAFYHAIWTAGLAYTQSKQGQHSPVWYGNHGSAVSHRYSKAVPNHKVSGSKKSSGPSFGELSVACHSFPSFLMNESSENATVAKALWINWEKKYLHVPLMCVWNGKFKRVEAPISLERWDYDQDLLRSCLTLPGRVYKQIMAPWHISLQYSDLKDIALRMTETSL